MLDEIKLVLGEGKKITKHIESQAVLEGIVKGRFINSCSDIVSSLTAPLDFKNVSDMEVWLWRWYSGI